MPYEHDPSNVKTDLQIKEYIRASYYTGDVTSTGWRKYRDTFQISWSRFWFVGPFGETGHAYVDMFVELAQLKWGRDKGYKIGHIAAYAAPLLIATLFASLVLWVAAH